jgi:hypothetical protein
MARQSATYGAYVVLTREEESHNGRVVDPDTGETVTYFHLGKPYLLDGQRVRNGYLRYNYRAAVQRARAMERAQWDSDNPPPF